MSAQLVTHEYLDCRNVLIRIRFNCHNFIKSTNVTPPYISSQHQWQRTVPLGSKLAPLLHCRLQTNLLLGATSPAAGQPIHSLRAETYTMAHADMLCKRTRYSKLFIVAPISHLTSHAATLLQQRLPKLCLINSGGIWVVVRTWVHAVVPSAVIGHFVHVEPQAVKRKPLLHEPLPCKSVHVMQAGVSTAVCC